MKNIFLETEFWNIMDLFLHILLYIHQIHFYGFEDVIHAIEMKTSQKVIINKKFNIDCDCKVPITYVTGVTSLSSQFNATFCVGAILYYDMITHRQ